MIRHKHLTRNFQYEKIRFYVKIQIQFENILTKFIQINIFVYFENYLFFLWILNVNSKHKFCIF